jgi:hypothetical protein
MEALYKLNDHLTLRLEGSGTKELFDKIDEVERNYKPIFGVQCCGICKGSYKFVVRLAEDSESPGQHHKYYELHCQNPDCQARFNYGVLKVGDTLFPKLKDKVKDPKTGKVKKDDKGNVMRKVRPNNGWSTEWKKFAVKDEPTHEDDE